MRTNKHKVRKVSFSDDKNNKLREWNGIGITNFNLFYLQTLQHLVWILGLKPVTGGGLASTANTSSSSTSAGGANENSSVITTAVMADLPVLSNMVTR